MKFRLLVCLIYLLICHELTTAGINLSNQFNVLHYGVELDLTKTFSVRKSIFDGNVTLWIQPKTDTLNTIILDAIKTACGDTTLNIFSSARAEMFSFAFEETPISIIFDPENKILLKEIKKISGLESENIISSFELYQNYPNPFNSSTKVRFSVKQSGIYRIQIYSVAGEILEKYEYVVQEPGLQEIVIDANKYSSGIYVYNLVGENVNLVKKMVVLK